MGDGAEVPGVHFAALGLWGAHVGEVFKVVAEGAGEVVAE